MRSTMKFVDARFASGRLKFPNLGELYDRCFPGETFDAHDALEDCKAVARCLPVIIENGLVELKVKEYDNAESGNSEKPNAQTTDAARIATESAKKFGQMPEKPVNAPISASNLENDKLPVQQEKAPQIENSAKLTVANELLDQNDF